MDNRLRNYLTRSVRLFAVEGPAWIWMLSSFGSIAGLALLAWIIIETAGRIGIFGGEYSFFIFAMLFAVSFLALFLILLRAVFSSLRQFTIFTLVCAGLSFAANAYVLSHEVFPPFTLRTEIMLWGTFAALAVSMFGSRLPEALRLALVPILAAGAFLCISFIIVLAPVMTFSWILVWAGGLGFLPYSPLFAFLAFVLNAWRIHEESTRKDLARWLAIAAGSLILAYAAYYKIQWNRAESILRAPEISSGHNRVDDDLPLWLSKAARLPVNHVTEMVLQPNRRSEIAFFSMQSQFDPLAFLASGGMSAMFGRRSSEEDIAPEDAGRILHILFGQSHAYLDRLWRGHSLITTNIMTHVQLHPELRTSYTETTLSIYNENTDSGGIPGLRFAALPSPEEAIYTITVPEGSICTKLSLWVNGEERPARLTFKSRAKEAYRQIVGVERRDPSYVEWLDGNRLRLRVFPVEPGKYRTVRIGIVSPLEENAGRLHYRPASFDGPVDRFAERTVLVDSFSKSPLEFDTNGFSLSEKVVPDGQAAQFEGRFIRKNWSFSMPAAEPGAIVSAGGLTYRARRLSLREERFEPAAVIVALNSSLARGEWKDFIRRLYQHNYPVYMLANEWFHTKDPDRALKYLENCELPAFNLFPLHFPDQHKLGPVLWVTSGENQSIGLSELAGSQRFLNIQRAARKGDMLALLNGRKSEYAASLLDLERLTLAALDEAGTMRILRERTVLRPSPDVIALRAAGMELEPAPPAEGRPGSDLLVRMALQRKIMQSLGSRFFDRDLDNADLVKLARDGMIVSPVSTLIVLESEEDYRRTGITDDPSLLGQSKLEAPGAVPEPSEIVLALVVLAVLALYGRRKWNERFFSSQPV